MITANDKVGKHYLNNLIILLFNFHARADVLRVLRQHGLSSTSMNDVFRATVLAKLLYCVPAWSGFCLAVDRERLDMFVRHCKRLRYIDVDIPEVAEMFESADEALFGRVIRNDKHVHSIMPKVH